MTLEKKLVRKYGIGSVLSLSNDVEEFEQDFGGSVRERWGFYLEKGALLLLEDAVALGEEIVIAKHENNHLEGRAVQENDIFYEELYEAYAQAVRVFDEGQDIDADAVVYARSLEHALEVHAPFLCYRSPESIETFSHIQKRFQQKMKMAMQCDVAARLYSCLQWKSVQDVEKDYYFIFGGKEDHPLLRAWKTQFQKEFKTFFPFMYYARAAEDFAFLAYLENKPLHVDVVGPVVKFIHHNTALLEKFPLPYEGLFEVMFASLESFVKTAGHHALLMPAVDIPPAFAESLKHLGYTYIQKRAEGGMYKYYAKRF